MPLFSIIAVHYQGTVPHEVFCRGIDSIREQTFKDFELLVYHDGPLIDASVSTPVPVICSEQRFNDFGHSLRDRGIREAIGDYIVHFNADNVLYPSALAEIANEIRRPPRMRDQDTGAVIDSDAIIIFPIKMLGLQRINGTVVQFKGQPGVRAPFYEIMTGNPPVYQNIDAMQLVMKRSLWLAEGGWRDKSAEGDGRMYEAFAKKYGYRTVGPVLGEHF